MPSLDMKDCIIQIDAIPSRLIVPWQAEIGRILDIQCIMKGYVTVLNPFKLIKYLLLDKYEC